MERWSDIEGLPNVIRSLVKGDRVLPDLVYRSKVKLHGTNAGIRIEAGVVQSQSRSSMITVGNDNCGFARWVAGLGETFSVLPDCTVFGEWVGRGIQRGCAIHAIDRGPILTVFAISVGGRLIVEPDEIYNFLPGHPDIFVLPWFKEHRINLAAPEVGGLNDDVARVEEEDPWVKGTFGVSGVGEGLVLYPARHADGRACTDDEVRRLMFKAKGEKHRVKAAKVAVEVAPEVIATRAAFVTAFVTEARLVQGLDALGGVRDPALMGEFLRWMNQDILKESVAELEVSGLVWRDVVRGVSQAARAWFLGR